MAATGRMSAVTLILIAAIVPVSAQSPATPAFEVASVRPSAPRTPRSVRVLPTRIDFVSTPLRDLLSFAFGLEEYRVSAPSSSGQSLLSIP